LQRVGQRPAAVAEAVTIAQPRQRRRIGKFLLPKAILGAAVGGDGVRRPRGRREMLATGIGVFVAGRLNRTRGPGGFGRCTAVARERAPPDARLNRFDIS
jgi:hypothetical protein